MHRYSLCQTWLNLKTHTVSETENRTSCLTTLVTQSQSVAVSQTSAISVGWVLRRGGVPGPTHNTPLCPNKKRLGPQSSSAADAAPQRSVGVQGDALRAGAMYRSGIHIKHCQGPQPLRLGDECAQGGEPCCTRGHVYRRLGLQCDGRGRGCHRMANGTTGAVATSASVPWGLCCTARE